jgi:hypothetical protein
LQLSFVVNLAGLAELIVELQEEKTAQKQSQTPCVLSESEEGLDKSLPWKVRCLQMVEQDS